MKHHEWPIPLTYHRILFIFEICLCICHQGARFLLKKMEEEAYIKPALLGVQTRPENDNWLLYLYLVFNCAFY